MRRNLILGLAIGLVAILGATVFMMASSDDLRVVNAAMKGDRETVRNLLKQAADVNAAAGDGTTALHWAALKGDADMAQMLVYAGANVGSKTRLGGYTPLFMASKSGTSSVVEVLIKAGSDVNLKGTDGLTPLMMAAMSGNKDSVRFLLDKGADVNAKESEHGQTAMIFAAAFDRADAIQELAKHGADVNLATEVQQPPQRPNFGANGQQQGQAQGQPQPGQPAAAAAAAPANGQPAQPQAQAAGGGRGGRGGRGGGNAAPPAPQAAQPQGQAPAPQQQAQGGGGRGGRGGGGGGNGATAPQPQAPQQGQAQAAGQQPPPVQSIVDAGGKSPRGGLTPLMYSARDGRINAARALVDNGAKLDVRSGDKSTALLIAAINGHFDVAKFLVEHGADVNMPSVDDATPLYGVLHVQWSRESETPQPSIKREQTSYLDLMKLLLDRGADPNAKLSRTLWYTSYGVAYESASDIGTTPFWKCSAVGDIDGMKLLLSRGADPNLTNKDGVTPLLIATGAGTHGNDDIEAPAGRLAAVKFLVEELHADVNASDNGATARNFDAQQMAQQNQGQQQQVAGQPQPAVQEPQVVQQQGQGRVQSGGGLTALHNAASRGDNEMILYLVSKGANVDAVTRQGVTVVDMANGPRQRVQPYASTVALLEMLGAKNNHKCVSC